MYSLNIATIAKQIQELIKEHSADAVSIAALQTYDDSETDTGMKWIDGNTIYRKVITGNSSPAEGNVDVSLSYSVITNMFGFYVTATGVTNNITKMATLTGVSGTTIRLGAASSASYQGIPYYIVVEYTKAPAGLLSPNPDDERSIEPDEKLNIEETPEEEPQEVKKTTRKKS